MLGFIIPVATAIATGKASTGEEVKAVKEYIGWLGMNRLEREMKLMLV